MSPQNPWNIKSFGHLKTRLFTIKKTSKTCRDLGGKHGPNKLQEGFPPHSPSSLSNRGWHCVLPLGMKFRPCIDIHQGQAVRYVGFLGWETPRIFVLGGSIQKSTSKKRNVCHLQIENHGAKIGRDPKGKCNFSTSNHEFSGAMLVLGRVDSVRSWQTLHVFTKKRYTPVN